MEIVTSTQGGVGGASPGKTPGGKSHIKGPWCLLYLLGVKNEVLVSLRVFSLDRSTTGFFAVTVRVDLRY